MLDGREQGEDEHKITLSRPNGRTGRRRTRLSKDEHKITLSRPNGSHGSRRHRQPEDKHKDTPSRPDVGLRERRTRLGKGRTGRRRIVLENGDEKGDKLRHTCR